MTFAKAENMMRIAGVDRKRNCSPGFSQLHAADLAEAAEQMPLPPPQQQPSEPLVPYTGDSTYLQESTPQQVCCTFLPACPNCNLK